MKKTVYNVSRHEFIFDSTRKGAKYNFYDELDECYKWGNCGEFDEVELKWARGLTAHKDPNGSYKDGSDIEETHTSVKGWNFTLTSAIKEDSFEKVLEVFKMNVASTNFSFTWREGDERVEYNMNMDEFEQFLYRFASYAKDRKTIRGPKFSMKKRAEVERWLEERVA
jgi:hypothetical protein